MERFYIWVWNGKYTLHLLWGVLTFRFPNIKDDLVLLIEAEWRIYVPMNLSSLVEIMACHLTSANPLFEPMLEYC